MKENPKTFLGDRDHLKQLFRGRRGKELLQKHGYETTEALFQTLISEKSQGAEYIIGLPGVGKTTFALHLGAQAITTKQDIHDLLTLDFDEMIFVTCDIDDKMAQQASQITLLHVDPTRLGIQRKERDNDIRNGQSVTAFGRQAGTTEKVTTDDTIMISRLKTDYEHKSRIVQYKSNNPDNRDEKENISVSTLSEDMKYKEGDAIVVSGKWSPAQIVHIEYQFKLAASLAQGTIHSLLAIIGETSGGKYDLGLSQSERIDLIDLEFPGMFPFVTSGTPIFIKNTEGEVIKITTGVAILGKDRLPVGFIQGTYEDIERDYPEFLKTRAADVVKKFPGYTFINMGNISMKGSDESISSTFIRKCLLEGNIDAIRPYLSPKIFAVLTSADNFRALKRRYSLIQKRNQELKQRKNELMWEYKQIHPLTNQPLMNKKGEPAFLTKTHANVCKNRGDQVKIMDYLEKVNHIIRDAEKEIEKKYTKLIYAPENTLKFT